MVSSTLNPPPAPVARPRLDQRNAKKATAAAAFGTFIEYDEFSTYGYTAVTLSPLFFRWRRWAVLGRLIDQRDRQSHDPGIHPLRVRRRRLGDRQHRGSAQCRTIRSPIQVKANPHAAACC